MSEFKYLYSMDESVKKLALYCLKEFPQPDFLAFYFRGIDIISHCALTYDSCNRDSHITDKEIEQFGDTVHRYYGYMDRILKELIENVSADTTVMIVSDHGFEKEPDGRFGHRKTKPPGLFVVNGPNVRTGCIVKNATVYDIAPTLLYLGDLPVSREMDGVVLTECVEESCLQDHPIPFIESYGSPLRHKAPVCHDSNEEIKERLRALGYID
jgi:predicted AlkP superfamily phosphohydrolase/phosphomutase